MDKRGADCLSGTTKYEMEHNHPVAEDSDINSVAEDSDINSEATAEEVCRPLCPLCITVDALRHSLELSRLVLTRVCCSPPPTRSQ